MSRLEGDTGIKFADCGTCVHLREGRTCSAFPDGIPDDIWGAEVKHREVRADQVGGTTYVERGD